jgi:hypothetical protein
MVAADPIRTVSATETATAEIRSVAAKTPASGWKVAELAKTVGRDRHNQSFKTALSDLIEDEEWFDNGGKTAARRGLPRIFGW